MKLLSRRAPTLGALAVLPLTLVCAALVHDARVASAATASSGMKPGITITNYSFHPGSMAIARDSTVTWVNKDADVHTIKSTDGPEAFNSPALDTGGRFEFTFHRAGTYHYVCSVHPYMHGVIVVR